MRVTDFRSPTMRTTSVFLMENSQICLTRGISQTSKTMRRKAVVVGDPPKKKKTGVMKALDQTESAISEMMMMTLPEDQVREAAIPNPPPPPTLRQIKGEGIDLHVIPLPLILQMMSGSKQK